MFGIIITIMFLLVLLNKELRKALKLNEENTKEETTLLSVHLKILFKYNSDLLMAVDINKQNKENVLQGKIKLLLLLIIMLVRVKVRKYHTERLAVVLFCCKSIEYIELRRGLAEPY